MVLLAGSLAMNGYPERARWWLASFCSVYSEAECAAAWAHWKKAAEQYPELAAISWPRNDTSCNEAATQIHNDPPIMRQRIDTAGHEKFDTTRLHPT